MNEPARVTRIADVPSVTIAGGVTWHPVRRTLGVGAFGVNGYSAGAAGEELIEDHDETGGGAGGHEELYVVVAGHASFTAGGEEIDAPAGTLVFVPDPATRRSAVAREPGTVALVVGGRPGEAYAPSPWEAALLAAALAQQGEHERARAAASSAVAEHPDHPSVLYNVACAEALSGDRDAALEHLRRAIERQPEAAEWARGDTDLDSVREDPRFPA